MSYKFVDSFRAGSGSILILLESCRVSYQNKFVKIVLLVGFIIKKKGFTSRKMAHSKQMLL